jgi:hypothetical protein
MISEVLEDPREQLSFSCHLKAQRKDNTTMPMSKPSPDTKSSALVLDFSVFETGWKQISVLCKPFTLQFFIIATQRD